jgi:hypothetical protein
MFKIISAKKYKELKDKEFISELEKMMEYCLKNGIQFEINCRHDRHQKILKSFSYDYSTIKCEINNLKDLEQAVAKKREEKKITLMNEVKELSDKINNLN